MFNAFLARKLLCDAIGELRTPQGVIAALVSMGWGFLWDDVEVRCHGSGACISGVSCSLCICSFLVESLECCVGTKMPKTCCVMGCCSGCKGTDQEVSLFCFPADAKQRESWRPVIPRKEAASSYFRAKVCPCVRDAFSCLGQYSSW